MASSAGPRARWWLYLLASVYLLTLCFNARQEAFGPASAGMQPDWPSLHVARVVPGSALDRAGVRSGDLVEAVAGHDVVGRTDWFLARANFERDRPTAIQIRRGEEHLHLSFTIRTPYWRTWNPGVVAFQAARVVVLLLAILVAFSRPDERSATLAALVFAMISVAEGFPSAGWAAALRHLSPILSIPIALASVSWLLIPVVWLSLCAVFPRPMFARRWPWRLVFAPLAVFVPLMVMSAVAVIYAPPALAMPSPFLDSREVRLVQSIMGVIPSLFINLWPLYRPARQVWLSELWMGVSTLFVTMGFVMIAVGSRQVRNDAERRRIRVVVMALVVVLIIGGHNILVRNWGNVFGTAPPALFSATGFVLEAVAFSFAALTLAWAVLKHRDSNNAMSDPAAPKLEATPLLPR